MRGYIEKAIVVCWFCVAATGLSVAFAGERTVARVTDISGQVFDVSSDVAQQLRILARVKAGSTLELSQNANLTLHFSANRIDLRFFGPTTVTVSDRSATSSNGISATKEHRDIDISIDLKNSDLGGVISRSIEIGGASVTPTHPVDTSIIADRPVIFRWTGSKRDGEAFHFALSDIAGDLIYAVSTQDNQIILSNASLMRPGQQYQWSVTAVSEDGRSNTGRGRFSTATVDESKAFYGLTGLTRGTVSDLVLYALALDQLNLVGEAEPVWQLLEAHHPGIRRER